MLKQAKARVKYYTNWCVAYTDPEFGNYYYSLLPKYFKATRQRYDSHITIVRLGVEQTDQNWLYRDGEEIEFKYDSQIKFVEPYFFLDVWSDDIADIRTKLGLPVYRFKDNPCYHITIANTKNA